MLLHIQIDVAHGASHHQAVGTVRHGIGQNAAGKLQHGFGFGHRHAGAAALGLVTPLDGLGAQRGHHRLHGLRLLRVVELDHSGRPYQQTPVVAGRFEILQGRADSALQPVQPDALKHLDEVEHARAVVHLGLHHAGDLLAQSRVGLHGLPGAEQLHGAHGAGRENLGEALPMGQREVARGQRDGQFVIQGVRGGGAAADPVVDLGEGHVQRPEAGAQRLLVVVGRAVQRAAGIVAEVHWGVHWAPPLAARAKIRATTPRSLTCSPTRCSLRRF